MEILTATCSDNKQIYYRAWFPENGNIHSILQILHGMAEHSARYDRFATYLNTLGIAVYAQDHRGHGLTASDDDLGWFAEKNGWERVSQDVVELGQTITGKHPGKDLFLLGHSMGAFLVPSAVQRSPKLYTGTILSGTAASKGVVGAIGKLVAKIRAHKDGGRRPDELMDNLSFGSFGRAFQPQKTSFDWLSRDEQEVQAYIADPLCGFVCTSRFFVDLLDGIALATSNRTIKRIPKDLPVYFISGANDPVGNFGKGVRKVYNQYKKAGIEDITLNLVKGARHELLNETNREEIHRMIGSWLEHHKTRKNR